MLTIEFRTAAVTVHEGIVTAIFHDGKENEMNLNHLDQDWYRQIAKDMGFGDDWMFYGVTHELTHHWLADRLAWNWSWSVYDNIRYEGPWPEHIAWEEHLVNNLQKFIMTGKLDDFNVIKKVLGHDLERVRLELMLLYRRAYQELQK